VARKKKTRQPRTAPSNGPTTPPLFEVGARVRVKAGVHDQDYPDIPLGGWSGLVGEIDGESQPPRYLIQWNAQTLVKIHPVYLHRSERDGYEFETLWLDETSLEPTPGDPAPMEQPTAIVPRPLQPHEQSDRIRAILGLTSDDPLPAADKDQLRKYHQFLSENLSFPFNAEIWVQTGPVQGKTHLVTVYRMLDPEEAGGAGNGLVVEAGYGQDRLVMPLASLETGENSPNRRLVQDYNYWLSVEGDEFGLTGGGEDAAPISTGTIWKTLLKSTVYGMGLGAVLGALLATQGDFARYGMYLGAVVLAVFGYLFGARYGLLLGAVNRVRGGPLLGSIFGVVAGGLAGSAAGILLVGYMGTIPGSIVGNLLGKATARFGWKPLGQAVWTLVGACAGGMILAVLMNSAWAVNGAMAGVLVGGVVTALVFLLVVVCLGLIMNARQ
jgi:Calcium binding